MDWDDLHRWVAAQAGKGGDLAVHVDLAPGGAGSGVSNTLRAPVLVNTDQPELIAWSAGDCVGGITRDDFAAANVDDETPTAVDIEIVSGAHVTLAWSPWPDRRHS